MNQNLLILDSNKIENLQWTQNLEYVNNLYVPGINFFIIDSTVATQIDLPGTSWWYVMHIANSDGSGFAVQKFYELGGAGRELRRWSHDTSWVGRDW